MIKWLVEYIAKLTEGKFFGQLVISFRAGTITNVRKEESVTLPQELVEKTSNGGS